VKSVEIVINTEGGKLENMSKLLVQSLRTFGGDLKDLPIYSYQPRKANSISEETRSFFAQNNVEHFDIELNKNYLDYPLANKPLACAYHENRSKADVIIFLDSDMLFLREPKRFLEVEPGEVFLTPVVQKNIGVEDLDGKNALYWHSIYKELGVEGFRFVRTAYQNTRILEYYNTGHIISHRSNGLYSAWLENFEKIKRQKIIPLQGHYFIEQSVFAATVAQLSLKVTSPGKEYNVPAKYAFDLKNPDHFISSLTEVVSLHYHKLFHNPLRINPLRKEIAKCKNGQFLNQMLDESKVITRQPVGKYLYKIYNLELNKFKQRLKSNKI
jgi:hypothetical protein